MRTYLKPLPLPNEFNPPRRAVTVVSSEARDVVYLDQSASIELITEALKAWGLRVRAEREGAAERKSQAAAATEPETHWQTTRPEGRAPTRLDNILSPLWLPTRDSDSTAAEAPLEWSWFSRAA
jgi:hypothetical protein